MPSRCMEWSHTRSRWPPNISDYHAVGDTVDKIDFANMAKVDRGVAAGVLRIADDPAPPQWSDASGAVIYREAGRK